MSDFNGRVGAIMRAMEKHPDSPGEARYAIRQVLRSEHADGWNEGYADGQDDTYATEKCKRASEERPARYAWKGTDQRGEEHEGGWQMIPAHVAAVVEDRFETGWRALVVTQDGEEVAGIRPHPEQPGETQWWAAEAAVCAQAEKR